MTVRSALRLNIARDVGDLIATGTPTAHSTTTIADTVNLIHTTNDQRKGVNVFVYSGTGIGQSRISSASTASTSLLTVDTWTATDSTSLYEVHETWNVSEYNQAIDAACDAAKYYMMVNKVDESLIMGNLLSNGLMATWSTAALCTGWTASGTSVALARESSVIYGRTYSAKLTTDTTNTGALSQSVANFPKYAGESATLRGWLYTATASLVTMRLTDGVTTWNTTALDGTEGWVGPNGAIAVELNSKSLSGSLTGLTASMQIAAGASATTAYMGRMELYCHGKDSLPSTVHYYDIPTTLATISEIQMETGTHNTFESLHPSTYKILGESTRKIYIANPIEGRALRLIGRGFPTKPTADTDTVYLNDQYCIKYAVMELQKMKTESVADQLYLSGQQRSLVLQYATPMPANTQSVEIY